MLSHCQCQTRRLQPCNEMCFPKIGYAIIRYSNVLYLADDIRI